MIITRTPFRVSFCGGGSDLPSFYREEGGCVLSTAIDKYFYLSVRSCFNSEEIVLKYSRIETVQRIQDIQHDIFRSVLGDFGLNGLEVVCMPDVPSGMGLGSSSSFTVGLFHALYTWLQLSVSRERLAREACDTELNKLGFLGGKQDQYAAAYGGLNFITFNPDDTVAVAPLALRPDTLKRFMGSILMFYVGGLHYSGQIHQEQDKNMGLKDKRASVRRMMALAHEMRHALERDELDVIGDILDEGWQLKKSLASVISNDVIDGYYQLAMRSGATGGKLLGAGGGGFLLFYCRLEDQPRLRRALPELHEVPVGFDFEGSKVLYNAV